MAGGIDQVRAVRHDDGAADVASRIDRGLNGGGIVGSTIAFAP
jgi:hypothetical protein